MQKDLHMHYTGSLPLEFIWQKLVGIGQPEKKLEEKWKIVFKDKLNYLDCIYEPNKYFKIFEKIIVNYFSEDDTKLNQQKFFDLYNFFQVVTKPKNMKISNIYYEQGVYSISKSNYLEGVKKFEIIAGPRKNMVTTKNRLESMIRGFHKFNEEIQEKVDFKIRLTFIRSSFNSYLNLDASTLYNLFNLLKSNPQIEKYVSGFDFSGHENPIDTKLLFHTVEEINKFSKACQKKYSISIHAGEDMVKWTPHDYFNHFQQLVKAPISSIGHGTFLWIPRKYLKLSKADEKKRMSLLLEFSSRNINFEICPTANVLLTPMRSHKEIPVSLFDKINLNYSINTDNKTIFSTTIYKEMEKL